MNIRLNLATRPYIELRPLIARLRLIAVALAVLAIPLILFMNAEEQKADQAEARASRVSEGIAALRNQDTATRARATAGPDAQVLRQADFLNTLFQRKAFSWTATMSDLEDKLPQGVQVQEIVPIVAPNGRVTIQMRVTGQRERAIDLVRNLEHSQHFIGARLMGESLSAQNNAGGAGQVRPVGALEGPSGNVVFDVLANYRPLSGTAGSVPEVPHRNSEPELTAPPHLAAVPGVARAHHRSLTGLSASGSRNGGR